MIKTGLFSLIIYSFTIPCCFTANAFAAEASEDAKSSLDTAITCVENAIREKGYKSAEEMEADNAIAKYCKPEFINFFTMCKEYENSDPSLGHVCPFMYATEMVKVSQRFGWKTN